MSAGTHRGQLKTTSAPRAGTIVIERRRVASGAGVGRGARRAAAAARRARRAAPSARTPRRGSGGRRRRTGSTCRCRPAVVAEEALRAEARRLGVELGAAVDEVDRRRDDGAGRQVEAGDRIGACRWRSTTGSTGRRRSASLPAASAYSSPPAPQRRPAARRCARAARRSSASAVAVVSWPATSSVTSSSRSSRSLIGCRPRRAPRAAARARRRPGSARRSRDLLVAAARRPAAGAA